MAEAERDHIFVAQARSTSSALEAAAAAAAGAAFRSWKRPAVAHMQEEAAPVVFYILLSKRKLHAAHRNSIYISYLPAFHTSEEAVAAVLTVLGGSARRIFSDLVLQFHVFVEKARAAAAFVLLCISSPAPSHTHCLALDTFVLDV